MFDEMVSILDKHGYTFKKQIGKGCFATCYLVEDKRYSKDFICKVCHLSSTDANSQKNRLFYQNEIDALINVTHPNIVKIYNHFTEKNYMFIILEYCQKHSLDKVIQRNGLLSPAVLFDYVHQFALGLQHCHSLRIAHHDIKPGNLLLDDFNKIKLADFGFASIQQTETKMICGSLSFIPPEKLTPGAYDPFPSDVWSFGVTVYWLATATLPFQGTTKEEIEENIRKAQFKIPNNVPEFVKKIVSKTIVADPVERWNMNDVVHYILGCSLRPRILTKLKINSTIAAKRFSHVIIDRRAATSRRCSYGNIETFSAFRH